MTTAGFKRLAYALAALILLGAGILFGGNYLISSDGVRAQALNELRAVTGLDPVLRGPTTVSLFPSGRVSFADVILGGADRPALTAERLTVRLRFFPLLAGRVEIADVALDRPTIAIDIDAAGNSNWDALIDVLARSQKPGAKPLSAFSEMRINGGTVVLHDAAHKLAEMLEDVQLSLAWPSISKSFGVTGHVVWHGEPLDTSFTLADFPAALAGARSGVKLRIAGAPIRGAFEGAISLKPTVKIDGTLAADSTSLRSVLFWLGQKPLPGGGFGRFSIKAQTNVVGSTIGLTGVNLELDGNRAEGVLTFATDGRRTLQGTLATDSLDLSPYISTVKLLTANQHEWSNGPIALDGLNGMDVDLRLSAASVLVADAKIGHTAIGANLRAGQLVVTIGEAQAYGGVIKGSMTLADVSAGVDVKSQLQFTDVDLQSALSQLFGLRRIEGKGNMALVAEGTGASVLAVTRTLNGSAMLTGENGAIVGLNVEQLLRRLERRPLSASGEFRTGRTLFDKMIVTLKIEQGTAKVESMTITGPAVKIALAGSAAIPTRDLDLTGTATLVTASRPGAQPFALPFIVQGSWDDPIMLPDAEALIRRSGAAAPLLNAVRDRTARDSVRDVLEKLTGSPLAPAAAPPPASAIPAAEQSTAPAQKAE